MRKEVRNWLDSAVYDLETAEHMYESGRYIYAVFMCHLALEKLLKAKVCEVTGRTPPRTHNLRYLVKLSGLDVSEETFEFLSKLSDVSIPTRYPQDFDKLVTAYSNRVAKDYTDQTREVFAWMKESLEQ